MLCLVYMIMIPLLLPQGVLAPYPNATINCERGLMKNLEDQLDTSSQWTLILRDLKHPSSASGREEAC